MEIGSTEGINKRFKDIEWQRDYIKEVQKNTNLLFTEKMKKKRMEKGQWLPETLGKERNRQQSLKI